MPRSRALFPQTGRRSKKPSPAISMTGARHPLRSRVPISCIAALLIPATGHPVEPPTVYTVNYPLAYFAERIGGDAVKVVFPVTAEQDPAFWSPTPAQIGDYQRADRVLLNGAGYARWLRTATLSRRKMVNTSRAFGDRLIESDNVTHTHGATGEHAHGSTAFTTWLDLDQASAQARAVREALIRLRPDRADDFQKRSAALERDLDALDTELQEIGKRASGLVMLGSHPVYQYLSRRYGLDIQSVHWEPDKVPDADGWAELSAIRNGESPALMLWEAAPNIEAVKKLEARGIQSVVFDPCANAPEHGNFLDVMRANVTSLRVALP